MKPEDLVKDKQQSSLHLNVRINGDEIAIYEELKKLTPNITDSQRVRDCVRVALYVMLKDRETIKRLKVF